MSDDFKIRFRGMAQPESNIEKIKRRDFSFINEMKQGYFLSYEETHFQFHVVDRFASFPLFYVQRENKLFVSEDINDLLPHLHKITFNPVGFFTSGGLLNGERTEHTPFEGIKRILPGHYVVFDNKKTTVHQYWSFQQFKGKAFSGTFDEASEELGFLLKQAVKRCYDFAPNAALHLSGGIDSGSIASLICQLSNDTRQSYSFSFNENEAQNPMDESFFIKKYQKHYPQLQHEDTFIENDLLSRTELIAHPENWYGLTTNHYAHLISQKANKSGHQVILTGLGGDELASYGHRHQNSLLSINSDFTNQLHQQFHNTINISKLKIKYWIGKTDRSPLDQMDLKLKMTDYSFWYTKDFINACKPYSLAPTIIPFGIPASYDYRLEILDRCFFSIRSDTWNFIGRPLGIDYLHPLLDGDVVDFCAAIPVHLFKNRPPRSLFKKALADTIPTDLLEGTKRAMNRAEPRSNSKNIQTIEKNLEFLEDNKQSKVNEIYNINLISRQLLILKKTLNEQPSNAPLNQSVHSFLNLSKISIHRINYIRTFFS